MPEVQTLNRNEVDMPLKPFKIVKGVNKDKEYLAPDITDVNNWENNLKWIGLPNVISCVQTFLKRTFQELWFDNVDETTGEFNMSKFLAEAADFTSAGMKLKEINDRLDELQATQGIIIRDKDLSDPNVIAQIKELNESILVFKAMKEARSRKKAEVEAEPAVPA